MANNRRPTFNDLPLEIWAQSMPAAGIPNAEITASFYSLSQTCSAYYGLFGPELARLAIIKQFWQAVIDGKQQIIIDLSLANPRLLYRLITQPMPNSFIIQSKLTFQIFELQGETLLSAPVKRKQLKVIQTLLSCCQPQLEHDQKLQKWIAYALSEWKPYQLTVDAEGYEPFVIPQEYKDLAQSSIEVFSTETFPNGIPGREGIPFNIELSQKTELALSSLLDILVPKNAVKLDDHIDMELCLLALFEANCTRLRDVHGEQLEACWRRTIGLTLPAQIPETGEICCESLEDNDDLEINPLAADHKLWHGEDFYRSNRDDRSGQGFDFFCNVLGVAATGDEDGWFAWGSWINHIFQKQEGFQKTLLQWQEQLTRLQDNDNQSGYAIRFSHD